MMAIKKLAGAADYEEFAQGVLDKRFPIDPHYKKNLHRTDYDVAPEFYEILKGVGAQDNPSGNPGPVSGAK